MSFLAVDKRTIDKLSADDQIILREVLSAVYINIDRNAPNESKNATDALIKIGIQKVEPDAGQFAELQRTTNVSNRDMANEGIYPLELFNEMQGHLRDYRARQGETSGSIGQ